MTKDEIKALALECGFSLNEQPDGAMDLHRYVYNFAEAMATFACKEELRTLRIENELLKTERNRPGIELRDQTGGYVYADQLLKAHLDQLIADGWRQCAKGQHTSQFCGQLETAISKSHEAIQALQIEVEHLRTERNRSGVELRNAVAKAVREERQRQRDKIEAHIGRHTTMSVYGTQAECKAARDALQRLVEDDA